jgi:hypothetical protein
MALVRFARCPPIAWTAINLKCSRQCTRDRTIPPCALELQRRALCCAKRNDRLNVQHILNAIQRTKAKIAVVLNWNADQAGHRVLRRLSQRVGICGCGWRLLRGNLSSCRAKGISCANKGAVDRRKTASTKRLRLVRKYDSSVVRVAKPNLPQRKLSSRRSGKWPRPLFVPRFESVNCAT